MFFYQIFEILYQNNLFHPFAYVSKHANYAICVYLRLFTVINDSYLLSLTNGEDSYERICTQEKGL